ncbi:hypothetical protein L6164_035889 [Bauhinia variegata]|uniref:Uncharacterized protein n=1 Tax=Bauhinia variegata TaxID=167791 RepID=A0ACB9KFG0_BAUVA|nr:hypothetical protein L6164_035889 [Bauhinia variegata]
MVELQTCATLVNASALRAIEQEVKGESANVITEISNELQREKQKNAELMERISILEAQMQERNKETLRNYQHAIVKSFKKFKRQKIDMLTDKKESQSMASQNKSDTEGLVSIEMNPENCLVNWMSRDDNQVLYHEKFKDSDSVADFDETDSDDDCDYKYDDNDIENGHINRELDGNARTESVPEHVDKRSHIQCLESFSVCQSDPTANLSLEDNENQRTIARTSKSQFETHEGEEIIENTGGHNAPVEVPCSGSGSTSQYRKPLKVAFCPKEVKRIIDCDALLQKNAQSHTIRKIIVFASLGIRHGCEDMYELDFNHFSIIKKGETYVSPRNPGEHVLYENPGVRRKIFYPNRQNPILCPVQILEEEKAMRPSDASCPSCLFLCIKYGGRTRNLPQNEYVRQRMGRNKLKSFGPLMCRMAMLVHIRSGSFFFKALGITLLFMAGFPDDLVQRETKYKNLDLLQKYYRTDEDAQGEELFLPHPVTSEHELPEPQNSTRKSPPTKSKGRKHTNSINKTQNLQLEQSAPSTSAPSQFGLTGYTSAHRYSMATFHSMPSQNSQDTCQMPNPLLAPPSTTNTSYPMLPPPPRSTFLPIMYWPPPNAFPPGPYPSTYGYQSFPPPANYFTFHSHPYYNHPSIAKLMEGSGMNDLASEESESDSGSTSGGTEQKQ